MEEPKAKEGFIKELASVPQDANLSPTCLPETGKQQVPAQTEARQRVVGENNLGRLCRRSPHRGVSVRTNPAPGHCESEGRKSPRVHLRIINSRS